MTRRMRWVVVGVPLLVAGAWMAKARFAPAAPDVPTAEVQQQDFIDYLPLRGDVRANKSLVLTAPSNAGDMQIVALVATGAAVHAGEPVVRFDTTTLERTLAQRKSELREAEAEIERMRAQGRLKEEEDLTEVMRARFNVERAKLEARKGEIVSSIEAEKSRLLLSDAEQKLKEMEQRLAADRAVTAAEIESRNQKRAKAQFEVDQTQRSIDSLTLRAPITGVVTLQSNWRAGGFSGSAPEFRAGDRAWAGAAIAELPDFSSLRVAARVDESSRGRIHAGQTVLIRIDAIPDREFQGKVVEISTLARPDYSSWPPTKNFDVLVQPDELDERMRPGMSAGLRIEMERFEKVLVVPSEAVFQKGGRSVVYVLRKGSLEERMITISRQAGGKTVVAQGLGKGERIATREPGGPQ